jgi:hypothetical protein
MSWRRSKYLDTEDEDEDMMLLSSLDYCVPPSRRQAQEDPTVILPPPSSETMEKRQAFRDVISKETSDHRRLQAHGGMGNTGRNIATVLRDRETYGANHCTMNPSPSSAPSRSMTYPLKVQREVQVFAEYSSVTKYQSSYLHHLGGQARMQQQQQDNQEQQQDRPASSNAVSTISIAFSPDSKTMASTHGDHTVKITSSFTGTLLQTLEGHPRTPWTVKFHPIHANIVASGCLGCQVRVWDWKEGTCLRMIRLDHAIISLSFHPSGHILAIASGSKLHFWDYNNFGGDPQDTNTRGALGALTEVEQRHMLRCVHFPPNGTSLIVGGTNPPTDEQRRRGRSGMSGGGMTFYLRLWDFDLSAALHPLERDARDVRTLSRTALRQQRKALSNVSFDNVFFRCSC